METDVKCYIIQIYIDIQCTQTGQKENKCLCLRSSHLLCVLVLAKCTFLTAIPDLFYIFIVQVLEKKCGHVSKSFIEIKHNPTMFHDLISAEY